MTNRSEAFTEETTKVAVDFVNALQQTTEICRELNHPVVGLRAKTLAAIVSLQHTARGARDVGAVATVIFLLSRHWAAAAIAAVATAFFYAMHKRAEEDKNKKNEELLRATDDYMNAEVRLQMAPAMSAAALRLAQLPRDQVVFVDAGNNQWTVNEMMQLMLRIGNSGEQTVLQFLLSCAVFGFPLGNDEQQPLNELNLENLKLLRSTTTWTKRETLPPDELPN